MGPKIVALAGGVGGAKLADGLARVLPPNSLTVIVNTGDDFDFLGLRVCPDLDTVCYTLAGLGNPHTGWGQKDETWTVFTTIAQLGGPDWFHIGDHDLGTHLERTRLLNSGMPLSEVTAKLCAAWKIPCQVLPMCDDPVRTKIETDQGEILDFQDYFVQKSWQPVVKNVHFSGVARAIPAPGVIEAMDAADLVIICPSNPMISIDPILAVPGMKEAALRKPVVSLSPIVGGQAIKGPLAKMIGEMYHVQPSAEWIANYYQRNFRLDGYIVDRQDSQIISTITSRGIICKAVPSIMITEQDRVDVAREVISFSEKWIGRVKLL